ncbi:cyclic GMP-AMP synthase-like isoform X2 [Odontomachus brunneus]|uniref:cyclic GMP-AMP synthase-like isoform X2 n=1 Tax=Odontomachus brunneus TaxID=486640 RepID=UPI0013F27C98|nr:cyclic GMP-AMP synthase-like isoform X2 [Odontomachus brunneus]
MLQAYNELIDIMKNQNSLFKKTFKRTVYTGSFYKKTKIGSPDEFDLNLIIKLPIKEDNVQFSTNLPGYIKICTNISRNNTLNMDQKAHKDMMSFIDNQTYLDQDRFRRWIERILSKATHVTNENNRMKLKDYTVRIKKSGPAFTLSLQIPNREQPISIDLVPVLAFSSSRHPPPCSGNYVPEYCNRDWFLVPKPLNNKNISDAEENQYWRLSFYEFEKVILSKYGRAKPIIRHLKKFRDTQNLKCIASYYIETLCFHHLHIFKEQRKSSTSLFFTMLKQLFEAFHDRCIKYYWDENVNLLEKIEYNEMKNIEKRLFNIIKNIEKQITEKPDNSFAIATYVLNSEENAHLKVNLEENERLKNNKIKSKSMKLNLESETQLEPKAESQGRCIIV